MQSNKQSKIQAHTVDQNFATNILFMAMSTLETLEGKLKSQQTSTSYTNHHAKQKEFAAYDKFDYSSKQINELKDQLVSHVLLLANSQKQFNKVHGKYQAPSNYNDQQILNRLNNFKKFFSNKDEECAKLTQDIYNIVVGSTEKLHFESMMQKFNTGSKVSHSTFMKNGVQATNIMQAEQEQVLQNIKSPEMVQFKANKGFNGNQVNPTQYQNAKQCCSQCAYIRNGKVTNDCKKMACKCHSKPN